LHLFFQVRFPQGIYHAIWDQDHWIGPSLIYLIRSAGEDDFGGRIHAHNTLPAVRAGNQLILTLTDSPSEVKQRLFFMQYTLEDVPMSAIEPTPTATSTPVPEASSTPALPPATQVPTFDTGALPPAAVPGPDKAIWSGAGPALLLVFSAIVFRLLKGARIR
jgi:hypothetical protein